MRRLLSLVGAALLAVVLLAVAGPAEATQESQVCKNYPGFAYTDHYICIDMFWRNQAGATGITVVEVDVYLTGSGPTVWENKMFDCDAMRVWNDADVVKWRQDGAQCDIYKADPRHEVQINFPDGLSMPNTNTAEFSIAGWPKFNNSGDPGRIVQSLTVHD
jgi:hypothetical protein